MKTIKKTKVKQIKGIGPVRFEQSERAKRINISIRADEGVRVAVPRGISFMRAEAFVATKYDWIIKHHNRLRQTPKRNLTYVTPPLEIIPAKLLITERLSVLAAKYGFYYNRVTIRNQKTRWGSCSHDNNISLNIRLAKLPQALMDYVLLHELVHTRIKNHSPVFWNELDYYVDNAKTLDKQLKRFKITNPKEIEK